MSDKLIQKLNSAVLRLDDISAVSSCAVQDAIELIESLQWISVEDRLPEEGYGIYLVFLKETMMRFDEDLMMSELFTDRWENYDFDEVTHWMPLPEPPK